MRIPSTPKLGLAGAHRVRRPRAFTLVEMMVSVFIFVFMVLGIIYAWMFGLRFDEVVCSKLGASDKARIGFDHLTDDIRSSKWWRIGNTVNGGGTNVTFTQCGNQTDQVGNAVKLSSSGDTNSPSFAIYFFATNSDPTVGGMLCYWSNGLPTVQIVAQNLTNSGTLGNGSNATNNTSMTFQAQQYSGSLAQDLQFKYLIVTTMEFCQYQYPLTLVGPGYYYNYYRIQLKAASHCPN